jgi:hypothetical protein
MADDRARQRVTRRRTRLEAVVEVCRDLDMRQELDAGYTHHCGMSTKM